MQLKVSEGKPSLEEEEEETGPGTKLGIVKLGKVAGKVSLGSRVFLHYNHQSVQYSTKTTIIILSQMLC